MGIQSRVPSLHFSKYFNILQGHQVGSNSFPGTDHRDKYCLKLGDKDYHWINVENLLNIQ